MTATAVTRCHVKGCPFATTRPDAVPWLCPHHVEVERHRRRPDPPDNDDDGSTA